MGERIQDRAAHSQYKIVSACGRIGVSAWFAVEGSGRYADTPTRRYADTPIRRHADTPTRRLAHDAGAEVSGRAKGEEKLAD
jgi:hypothetical protein